MSERVSFEDAYFSLVVAVESFMKLNEEKLTKNQTAQAKVSIQLPVITLPTFSGSYDEWLSFSDIFKSIIDKNESLTNVQKFNYLRSVLKGEAAFVVQSLESTDCSYQIAWQLLESRYENKKYLVNKHVKTLFNLAKVQQPVVSDNKLIIH